MICDSCKRQDHNGCLNPTVVRRDGSFTRAGTRCDCQHRVPDPGQQITDEINADPVEVERLRASREQAKNGERSRRVPL